MQLISRLYERYTIELNIEYKVEIDKNIEMSSLKSSENIQKKEGGPDRPVSDYQSSSVTLNELALKARKIL